MPPSGFSQEAINGLLEFVNASYEATLAQYNEKGTGLSEADFLKITASELEDKVRFAASQTPLAVSGKGTAGLVTFITTCYKDLVREIYAGHDRHGREVTDGKAIQKELDQIGAYLKGFTI